MALVPALLVDESSPISLPTSNNRKNVDRTLVINDGVGGDGGGEGDGVMTVLVAGLVEGDAGAIGELLVLS